MVKNCGQHHFTSQELYPVLKEVLWAAYKKGKSAGGTKVVHGKTITSHCKNELWRIMEMFAKMEDENELSKHWMILDKHRVMEEEPQAAEEAYNQWSYSK